MKKSIKDSLKWSFFISLITLILSIIITVISTIILAGVSWGVGMIVVFIIVIIGIVFDMVGIAAAIAEEKPFHSMASEKLSGAKQAIRIVRNADKFSNFCNDVIGDISGIISGTTTAVVVIELVSYFGENDSSYLYKVISILFTSVVAAVTVGGKGLGKTIALLYSTKIILFVGKFFALLEKNFKITLLNNIKKSKGKVGE